VSIAIQILDGLSAVHADGLIHRDVKPANVLVDRAGRVRLTDFGIAKRLDDIEENLTSAGMVVGTPTYLAPEQAAGARLGVATDVYLVGLVLYEMLTGRRPTGSALDPRGLRPDVPGPIANAVMRATDPVPHRRFGSAQEMIDHLRVPALSPVATLVAPAVAAARPGVEPTAVMPGNRALGDAPPTTAIAPVPIDPVPTGRSKRGWLLLAAAAIVVALVVGLLAVAGGSPDESDEPALSNPTTSFPPATSLPVAPVVSAPPTTALVVPVPDQGEGGNGKGGGHGNGKKDGKGKDD
jgi:serine/threonine protein kinase